MHQAETQEQKKKSPCCLCTEKSMHLSFHYTLLLLFSGAYVLGNLVAETLFGSCHLVAFVGYCTMKLLLETTISHSTVTANLC